MKILSHGLSALLLAVTSLGCSAGPEARVAKAEAKNQRRNSERISALEDVRDLHAQAENAVKVGDDSAALALLIEALERAPEDKATLLKVARLHSSRGEIQLALADYERLLKREKIATSTYATDPIIWCEYAEASLEAGNSAESTSAFVKVAQVGDNPAGPDLPRATAPRVTEAERALAYLVVGNRWWIHGKYDISAEYYQRALELAPNWEHARLQLALVQWRQENYDEARRRFAGLSGSSDQEIRRVVSRYYQPRPASE